MSEIKSQNKPKHFLRETAFYQRLCRLKAAGGRFACPPPVQTAFKQKTARF
ncbi:hypothetical protein NEILACOT_03047 [Neisseria lactamica ATCC 23970]|uniref:Uncharacterized protein n=1 Tax=Neisseria lactamica ATCC 23970 TaxID=546265 RepID=D0W6B0_NEILA|nr:hypothetical protein NEILACOT_03047 [Neisseria lactamica ATCC 23970]KER40636.1 hypothetical protein F528_0343 [Neisseria meningitidis 992008]